MEATTETTRRGAIIYITATKGNVRAAKGIVGAALRKVLKIRRWNDAPHYVTAYAAERHSDGWGGFEEIDPCYRLYATDDEMVAVVAEIWAQAEARGWNRAPIDWYHEGDEI